MLVPILLRQVLAQPISCADLTSRCEDGVAFMNTTHL